MADTNTLLNPQTLVLTAGTGSVSDTIDSKTDADWIKFAAVAGTAYTFTLAPANGSTVKAKLSLLDRAGTKTLASADANQVLTWMAPTTGDVFLKVAGNGSTTSNSTGNYTVSATQIADDYSLAAPGSLAAGTTLNGAVQWNTDHDVFKLADAAGAGASPDQEWRLAYTPASGYANLGVKFVNASGGALTAKGLPAFQKGALGELFAVFNHPAPGGVFGGEGTAYLDISNSKGGLGGYSVQLQSDDYSADTGTRAKFAALEEGDSSLVSRSGHFAWEGDKDWIKFEEPGVKNQTGTLAAGVTYTLMVTDSDNAPLEASDVAMRLLDASGKVAVKGLNNGSLFNLAKAGTYYLEMADIAGKAGHGDYIAYIDTTITDDFGNTTASAGKLSLDANGSAQTTGKLEAAKDSDWIKIDNLVAGNGYDFTVKKLGSSSLDNIHVDLLNSSGKAIAGIKGDGTAGTAWVAYGNTSANTVYLAITDNKNTNTNQFDTGSYAVTVNKIIDDASTNTSTTATAIPGDTFLGQIDWAGDVDWVKVADPDYDAATSAQEWRLLTTGYNVGGWAMKLYDANGVATKDAPKWSTDPDDSSVSYGVLDLAPQAAPRYAAISNSKGLADTYTVELLTDDYSANTKTQLAATGSSADGWSIDANWAWSKDKDWARLDLGTLSTTSATKLEIADANDFYGMKFALYDAKGNAVVAANKTINGEDHAFSVKGGVYYLQIENTSADMVGDYHLEITLAGVPTSV